MAKPMEFFGIEYKEGALDPKVSQLIRFAVNLAIGHEHGAKLHLGRARELVVERLPVDFIPQCMAFDGERFWYAEAEKNGIASTEKDLRQL